MFFELLRLLSGYVLFRAEGGFSERFINLCSARNIEIRSTTVTDGIVTAETSVKNYRKLRKIASLSGMKIRVVNKKGLPFFISKNKKRVGLIVGMLIASLFLVASTFFIWNIEIIGEENTNKRVIRQELEALGLYVGAFKGSIDSYELADKAMIALSGKVSWLAVNIRGSTAAVEVRDYIEWREDKTYSEPSNIVADFDGLVLSVDVFNGKKEVSEGSAIKKGDLLISGIVENRDTSTLFLDSAGEITAFHVVSDERAFKENEGPKKYIKLKTVGAIKFMNVEIPFGFLGKEESCDDFVSEKKLRYKGRVLPFSYKKITRAYYENSEITNENLNLLCDFLINENYERFKNTLILSESYKIYKNKGKLTLNFSYDCIDFAGKREKIELQ